MKKIKLTIILILTIAVLWGAVDVLAARDYRLVKTVDDAKVFLIKENRRIHIPNPSVFEAGGYSWDDIETVSNSVMSSIKNTALIKSPVSARVYLISDGKKQWIPNEEAFLTAGLQWGDIVLISQPQVEFYLEDNYNKSDAVKVVDSLSEETSEEMVEVIVDDNSYNSDDVDTNNMTSVDLVDDTDDYERPEEIKVQEIGKYSSVHPDSSNTSIENTRLFADGSVLFAKNTMDGEEFISKNYIWKNGVSSLYTEADYLVNMNNNGQKVIMNYDLSERPFFLDNGVLAELPTFGGRSVGVSDMNNSGQLVGGSDFAGGEGASTHAFLWQNSAMKDLGTLGGDESHAIAINDNSQVIGYSKDANNEGWPFIWENNKMNKILTPNGNYFESVEDINNNGLILGKVRTTINSCGNPSCLTSVYFKDNNLVYLEEETSFVDTNNYDEIFGTEIDGYFIDNIWSHYSRDQYSKISDRVNVTAYTDGYASLYINGDTMRLDDLIGDENITFTGGTAINDRGQILTTGFNFADDHSHEYLISLPKNIPPTFHFTVDGDNTVLTEEEKQEEDNDWMFVEYPSQYEITWTDSDPDDDATISLYYYYYGVGHQIDYQGEGELLVSGLSEDSDVDKYVWDMSNLRPGYYHLYAVIDDGNTTKEFASDRLKSVRKAHQRSSELEVEDVEEEVIIK